MNSDKTVVCGFVVLAAILQNTAEDVPIGHEIMNECCHLKILNHKNLYYGENVTLVFRPKKTSTETPEINNTKSVPFDYVYQANNETHTFVLLNCRKTLQYADFYVTPCTQDYVRLRFNEDRPASKKVNGQATGPHAVSTTTIAKINDTATDIQHVNVTNVNDQTQSPKTVTEKNNRLTSTKSTTDRRAGSTTKELFSTTQRVVPTSSPSDALKTTENFIPTTNTGHGKNDKRTKTTSTTKSQPISNDANTDKIDTSVLNPSASNDGFQNVIIAVACAVSALIIVIAVVIAVVCVKRKRRSLANVPLQDTPREDQVAQEEAYASIGGSECQYAVVNKPKKHSTLQVKQDPPVDNKPMEMQPNPEKISGAGELIYADLDKEALKAKPSNSKPAVTHERPRTPTEYVGIDFARTVALQDANKLEE